MYVFLAFISIFFQSTSEFMDVSELCVYISCNVSVFLRRYKNPDVYPLFVLLFPGFLTTHKFFI